MRKTLRAIPEPGLPLAVSSTWVVRRPIRVLRCDEAHPAPGSKSCQQKFSRLLTLRRQQGVAPPQKPNAHGRSSRNRLQVRRQHVNNTPIILLTFPMAARPSRAAGARSAAAPAGRKGRAAASFRAAAAPGEDEIFARIYAAVLDHRLQPGTKLKEVA